jgi:hypothetical protein
MSNVVQLPTKVGDWQATGSGHAVDGFMDVREGRSIPEAATRIAIALMDDLRDAEGDAEKLALLSGMLAMFLELIEPAAA